MTDLLDLLAETVQAERAGLTARNNPATSHTAARAVAPRTGTQRWRTLQALNTATQGLTASEAAEQLGHRHPHVIGTRLIELREHGLVERNGHTRPTDSGNPAEVYVITPLGRAVLQGAP